MTRQRLQELLAMPLLDSWQAGPGGRETRTRIQGDDGDYILCWDIPEQQYTGVFCPHTPEWDYIEDEANALRD